MTEDWGNLTSANRRVIRDVPDTKTTSRMAITEQKPSQVSITSQINERSVRDALEYRQKFDEIKRVLLRDTDVMEIRGKTFIKKSGWRVLALAFNISDKLVERVFSEENGVKTWTVIVEAIAPNGRIATGIASCASDEPGRVMKRHHDLLATAHTRAKNRAISDLIAAGEVSAEEIGEEMVTETENE